MTDRKALAREFLEAFEMKLLCDKTWKSPSVAARSEDYKLGYGQAILDIATNIIGELKKRMEEQNDDTEITCKECKHLMFSDCYGECNKALRIVNPDDTCEYAERKEQNNERE